MQENAFLSVEEKQVKCRIKHMCWSPKRDLIAMAADTGELLLYRLSSLERVWSFPPPDKQNRISAICWRPDGSVIAVAYNCKENGIAFVYMEKAQVLWTLTEENSLLENAVTSIKWVEYNGKNDDYKGNQFSSLSFKDYLPELPKLQFKDLKTTEVKSILGDLRFHILVTCDKLQTITLYAYGVFPLMKIPSSDITREEIVVNMTLSPDLSSITCLVASTRKEQKYCDLLVYDISEATSDLTLCDQVAKKACHLNMILLYIQSVIDLMNESCESVVQEMESKLTNYLLNKNISGTIGDEFMHMLMWGKPSDVLEDLLTNCMSKKGVMKLGTLVEASYTSIQQLLLVNFQLAADAIYYHLHEIKGMSNMDVLGYIKLFDSETVDDIIKCAGSFILKASEMQQVIGRSLKNFKAFFRWLYATFSKIQREAVDNDSLMSMKELEFVADFIVESFIHEHEQLKVSGKERHFNLDKVYQYLQDAPLTAPQNLDKNEWFSFVDSVPSLAQNPLILKRRPDASLCQLYKELRSKIRVLLNRSFLTKRQRLHRSRWVTSCLSSPPHSCQWFDETDQSFYTLICTSALPCKELSLVKLGNKLEKTKETPNHWASERVSIRFDNITTSCGGKTCQYLVQGIDYYKEDTATLLLKSQSSTLLVQLSVRPIFENQHLIKKDEDGVLDVSEYVTHGCVMDPMVPVKIASSGTRKVCCVLGTDLRHIKAYVMDQDEEDDYVDENLDVSA
ncbi:anaphase-promoting complex subunit 4-like [Clavelina lepadiformis]|uniref:anaphase-promoting complex subunit 4-like n=1 Tax=Clavelina lepadiformis TaxID=159417 RepID=UPI004042E4CD